MKINTKTNAEEIAEYAGSAVNLRKTDWKLLRRVAEVRAAVRGGRPSVSKVLESLIDRHKEQLQNEASRLTE